MSTTLKHLGAYAALIAVCIAGFFIQRSWDESAANKRAAQYEAQDHYLNHWDGDFIANYEQAMGPIPVEEQERLIENADKVCNFLDQDAPLPIAYDYATGDLDMSGDQAVVVIKYAILTHCTEHSSLLDG